MYIYISKANNMTPLSPNLKFELDSRLDEVATIEQSFNGYWGFMTTRAYSTWDCFKFDTFEKCLANLIKYEKTCLKSLKNK